jgi:ribosomal protein L1
MMVNRVERANLHEVFKWHKAGHWTYHQPTNTNAEARVGKISQEPLQFATNHNKLQQAVTAAHSFQDFSSRVPFKCPLSRLFKV